MRLLRDVRCKSSSRGIRSGKLDKLLEEVSVTAWPKKSSEAVRPGHLEDPELRGEIL